jgi:hypothetical protein
LKGEIVDSIVNSIVYFFECLSEAAKNNKVQKGFRLVWHATLWTIWKSKNNHIFNDMIKEPIKIVEEIEVLAWRG